MELVEAKGGRLLWWREYEGRREDPEALRRLLTRALREAMNLTSEAGPGPDLV